MRYPVIALRPLDPGGDHVSGTWFAALAAVQSAHQPIIVAGRDGVLRPHNPLWFSPTCLPFAFDSDYASFPSGHATNIFALATVIGILWPRGRVLLYTIAAVAAMATQFGVARP